MSIVVRLRTMAERVGWEIPEAAALMRESADTIQELAALQTHWELEHCPACPDLAEFQLNQAENAKLRELVRCMFYAVHPCDRAQFLANVAELGIEVDDG